MWSALRLCVAAVSRSYSNVNRATHINRSRVNVNRIPNLNRRNATPNIVNRTTHINRPHVNVNRTPNLNRRNVTPNINANRTQLGVVGARRVITPGPGRISTNMARPGNASAVRLIGGRVSTAWRAGAPRRIWWGGSWRAFLPITALGAVVIGGAYFYPDAYLAVAQPYCAGFSPEGCRLNWQFVGFEDGGGEWQCVQYCARPGAPPPPRTVALVAPPPVTAAGQCVISIFSEPEFGGSAATINTEQPNLAESGWQNEIA